MSEILKALTILAKLHDADLSPERAALYEVWLKERYTLDEIKDAARGLIYSCRGFPTIAHFAEAIDGKPLSLEERILSEARVEWQKLTAHHWGENRPSELALAISGEVAGTNNFDSHSQKDLRFIRSDFLDAYLTQKREWAEEDRQRLLDEAASGTTQLLDEPKEG